MSSIDDIGFPKEVLQNPARIRPSDEFLIGFERILISKSYNGNKHLNTQILKYLKTNKDISIK